MAKVRITKKSGVYYAWNFLLDLSYVSLSDKEHLEFFNQVKTFQKAGLKLRSWEAFLAENPPDVLKPLAKRMIPWFDDVDKNGLGLHEYQLPGARNASNWRVNKGNLEYFSQGSSYTYSYYGSNKKEEPKWVVANGDELWRMYGYIGKHWNDARRMFINEQKKRSANLTPEQSVKRTNAYMEIGPVAKDLKMEIDHVIDLLNKDTVSIERMESTLQAIRSFKRIWYKNKKHFPQSDK